MTSEITKYRRKHSRSGFNLNNGFAVMCVPDSGLFAINGIISRSDGSPVSINELILFSRCVDAESHARSQAEYWKSGYHFLVIPVLVSERL